MISDYLNYNLTEELGLDDMPNEKREELVSNMEETLASRINLALLDRMTDEQKQEFGKLLDSDGDVSQWLEDNVRGADLVAAEVVADFKREMLELYDQVSQAVTDHKEAQAAA